MDNMDNKHGFDKMMRKMYGINDTDVVWYKGIAYGIPDPVTKSITFTLVGKLQKEIFNNDMVSYVASEIESEALRVINIGEYCKYSLN